MDDKDIKLDLSGLDELLDRLVSKDKQTEFDFEYPSTISHAATISQTASPYTWPYITSNSGTYTLPVVTNTGTGNVSPGLTFSDTWRLPEQSLHVRGDAEFEGDIKLKGKSLSNTLEKIEERLAILHPNEQLEEKWEELKKLGDMYRALEKDIQEKEKIWDTLKK
jgi:hypothetical protein